MQTIRRATTFDLILLIATAFIWASAFVAIKIAVPETGPMWLAACRVVIGLLVLAPYSIYRGLEWPKGSTQWLLIGGMALLNIVIPFFLIAWAGKTIDAGVLSLLMGTGPFLALVGSHVLTHDDKMTTRKLVGVALGFCGILVVVGPSALSGLGHSAFQAQAAVLGASLCYVTAGLLIRRIDMPPVRLACFALAIGAAILVPAAMVTSGPPSFDLSAKAIAALVFLGALPTGLTYIMRFHLIRKIGYSSFSMAVNLIPVFGVILGYLVLDEPLRPAIMLALILVLAGLFVSRGRAQGAHHTQGAQGASQTGEKP